MSTDVKGNKMDSKFNMKGIVTNYYPDFFEFTKISLKVFGLNLIVRSLSKLKTILNTKNYPVYKYGLSEVYIILFIREMGVKNYYIAITRKKFNITFKEHVADVKYNV